MLVVLVNTCIYIIIVNTYQLLSNKNIMCIFNDHKDLDGDFKKWNTSLSNSVKLQ